MSVAPGLKAVKLLCALLFWFFLWKLDLLGLWVVLKATGWAELSGVSDPSKLLSEEVPFLTWEGWAAVDLGVEVTSKSNLDLSCDHKSLWLGLWQLNPVLEEVVSDPEDVGVGTLTSLLLELVGWKLLLEVEGALGNPVILMASIDLTEESETLSSTHNCKSLE